jgi:hypothetical protein
MMIQDQSNVIHNTLVACRLPINLKERAEAYGRDQDLNLSQIIRRGILLVLKQDDSSARPTQWQVQR